MKYTEELNKFFLLEYGMTYKEFKAIKFPIMDSSKKTVKTRTKKIIKKINK